MNSNWPRWFFASISKHYHDTIDLSSFIEGQHRDTRLQKDFIEIRVDGPVFTESSRDQWLAKLAINIIVQSVMDDESWHRVHTNVGLVAAAFTSIQIYKYGSGPDDDQSLLACMKLDGSVRIHHMGQVEPAKKLLMSVVSGNYKTEL